MKLTKKLFTLALSLALFGSLAACGSESSSSSPQAQLESTASLADSSLPDAEPTAAEPITILLGVVGENNEQWTPVIEALAKENVTLELVKFADYSLPNTALADGDIDLNAFQHYAYLNNEIADTGYELTVIGETIIAPLGVYSDKISSLDDLQEGDKIAIPSDATNGGRSLKLFETAGIITVDPDAGYTPTISDITSNPLNIEFVEVEAALTASLLPDVAAAVINGGHAVDNGFVPADDSIYLEEVAEGGNNPYINILVARTEDKDNALYQRVVELFQTDEVAKTIEEAYLGSYIPAW